MAFGYLTFSVKLRSFFNFVCKLVCKLARAPPLSLFTASIVLSIVCKLLFKLATALLFSRTAPQPTPVRKAARRRRKANKTKNNGR